MGSYRLSNLASDDLGRIYEYGILNFGLIQAQDNLLGLHERFQKLVDNELPVRDASQFVANLKRSQYQMLLKSIINSCLKIPFRLVTSSATLIATLSVTP